MIALTRRLAPAVLAGTLALTGCAGTSSNSSTNAAQDGCPITLSNTFGSTTINTQPERVATIAWGNHDTALALGFVPVGMQGGAWADDNGDGILPWTYEALEQLGATGDKLPKLFDETDGINFEQVDSVSPDVVLAAYSGLSQDEYGTLSAIAPTISFPQYAWGTSWRDMALTNGAALCQRAAARAKVDEVDALITETLPHYPDVAGKTVAYTWIDPADSSSIWIYSPTDARVQFTKDLGMSTSAGVLAALGGSTDFGLSISSERADAIDADILVTYGNDETLAALQANPLFSKIPAVARGSVVVLPTAPIAAATSGPTVLSIPWVLNDYLALFEAAAKQVA